MLSSGLTHATEIQKPRMVESKPLEYPEDAKKLGHQGTVVVQFTVLSNDTISTPTIKTSSRSSILDQAAISFVQQIKFAHGTDDQGNATDTAVALPVSFRKDASSDLSEKTCADFVIDYQWFTQTFPEQSVKDMTVYQLTLGLLVLQKSTTDEKLKLARNFGMSFQKTYSDCDSNRDLKFMQTLLGNLN